MTSQIPMDKVSEGFASCWLAAAMHLDHKFEGGEYNWLKCHLAPPFLEHLSFRLGNQLFFIRVEDADGQLDVPGTEGGLNMIADDCHGHACLMPMKCVEGEWKPAQAGWGLLDLHTHRLIDPVALISDQKIEMTDWELQDFAVQVVREQIESDGYELMSWQSNPSINPSIWFVGDDGPEWVIVRTYRDEEEEPQLPHNWKEIADGLDDVSSRGNFAPVFVFCIESMLNGEDQLYRGCRLLPEFNGLEPLNKQKT